MSPYIKSIKDWKLLEIVLGFLEAKEMFEHSSIVSFHTLRKICNTLYETKENYRLIFKKIIDPRNLIFEAANKYTPNENEINFSNILGLLFHKVLVARELKYVSDYYREDSISYQDTKSALERNLIRIQLLFNQGIDALKKMLASHKDNIYLISYFLENPDFCTRHFQCELETLLDLVTVQPGIENAYLKAAKYYADSGWYDKMTTVCNHILQLNPQNKQAKILLDKDF